MAEYNSIYDLESFDKMVLSDYTNTNVTPNNYYEKPTVGSTQKGFIIDGVTTVFNGETQIYRHDITQSGVTVHIHTHFPNKYKNVLYAIIMQS